MSKKQKTYFLLAVVILVWGAVAVQIYRYYEPSSTIPFNTVQKFKPKTPIKKVDYTIKPDYRDPFLGKLYKKPKPKVKRKQPKPEIVFPTISYHGVINGENKTYIISIDGSQEIFKVKDIFKGVELIRGNEKEITMKFQGKTKKYPIRR